MWADRGFGDYTMIVEVGRYCPEAIRGPFQVVVTGGAIDTVNFGREER